MNYSQIRKTFLDYFSKNGHTIVPSVSLIPNDPTLLFTVAGMVPWKGMLQGTEQLKYGARVADVQKCLRAGGKHNDLEDVGFDGRHHTFFEMMGNWSFGDYFKEGAIEMSWELLTKEFGLDPSRIVVTTHTSDDEATAIWKKVAGKEAIRLGDKSNWWAAGDVGPCGPCTEMFYDFGSDVPGGLPGSANEDDGRFVEIWNDVFMQFDRDANGNLSPLPKQNVDTGAGLERFASIMQNKLDNYDTDLFVALKSAVSDVTGVLETESNRPSFKVITDHLRSVGFAIADGVVPGNTDRGYVIRRILRRAMRHGQILGHKGELLSKLYPVLIEQMGDTYPELKNEYNRVVETIRNEEHSFADMLENGMKLLDKEVSNNDKTLSGETAFKLYDTYGFPLDLTQMILRDRGIDVDVAGFEKSMNEQKERSRADTKGTRTLWEGRINTNHIQDTEDNHKYKPEFTINSKVIDILKNGEFVESASGENRDEIEVVLDKTKFYGTQGGQVGDTGTILSVNQTPDKSILMTVSETFKVGNVIIHKGILIGEIQVGESVIPVIDNNIREQTARAHTAAHLLQAALRKVLGDGVEQRGSKVSPDSVRFDFSFGRAMTKEELTQVEDLINKWIDADLTVKHEEMTIEAARAKGAMALFGEKYGDTVRVITAGDISCELCGGTHATNTGQILHAKINKEKSISSGIRRITMSVGNMAE